MIQIFSRRYRDLTSFSSLRQLPLLEHVNMYHKHKSYLRTTSKIFFFLNIFTQPALKATQISFNEKLLHIEKSIRTTLQAARQPQTWHISWQGSATLTLLRVGKAPQFDPSTLENLPGSCIIPPSLPSTLPSFSLPWLILRQPLGETMVKHQWATAHCHHYSKVPANQHLAKSSDLDQIL